MPRESFRDTKESRIKDIADTLERAGADRSAAILGATKRVERVMDRVVHMQTNAGKSRPTEI